MIIALFNNLFVVILALICVMKAASPVLMFAAAGLMMIFITAGEMEINMTAEKLAAAVCFAFSGGFFPAFVIFAVLDRIGPVKKAFLGMAAYMVYFFGMLIVDGDKPSGEKLALFILRASLVFVLILTVSFLKKMMGAMRDRTEYNKEMLKRSNIRELHEKQLNRELAIQNYLVDKNARLVERENISRNIHNSVGHSITAAIMTLDAADMLYEVEPEKARQKMNDANERIRGSLESIRRAVRTLDEDGKPVPVSDLISDFNGIIDEFVMDTKIKVDRIWEPGNSPDEAEGDNKGDLTIPHEHAEFLTGVLKEFLTNGVKHGNADHFIVTLTGDSAHLRLSVKDNGQSDFTDENSEAKIENGFGIKKIQSYVGRIGGKAEFSNDDGFRAAVELPLL